MTMATQEQIGDIRTKVVDEQMDPRDVANYFSRIADLDELATTKVFTIAVDIKLGKTVEADGRSIVT